MDSLWLPLVIYLNSDQQETTRLGALNEWSTDVNHTVPHVTLLVSKGKFPSGLDFFLSPPENKKAFAL